MCVILIWSIHSMDNILKRVVLEVWFMSHLNVHSVRTSSICWLTTRHSTRCTIWMYWPVMKTTTINIKNCMVHVKRSIIRMFPNCTTVFWTRIIILIRTTMQPKAGCSVCSTIMMASTSVLLLIVVMLLLPSTRITVGVTSGQSVQVGWWTKKPSWKTRNGLICWSSRSATVCRVMITWCTKVVCIVTIIRTWTNIHWLTVTVTSQLLYIIKVIRILLGKLHTVSIPVSISLSGVASWVVQWNISLVRQPICFTSSRYLRQWVTLVSRKM